jgi:hypothetical protein
LNISGVCASVACDANATSCLSTTKAASCVIGYELNTSNGSCLACPANKFWSGPGLNANTCSTNTCTAHAATCASSTKAATCKVGFQ